ncbi:magnesium transporter NIPA2-like isoform X1 [Dinothrombium tinctorium]|uniref:Magnesium transporter NIPA2-like isoform X1 n=1 Tax=Dinothrombium tinctorium TaxID=1965070 RepID=A0A443QHZ3_9ACAR|nr:magnesium transporter NIPA2-like isoform X1 [Dinothrombium tinctorium]
MAQNEFDERSARNFTIGLLLAISSTFFIGSSFIIKKKGLMRLSAEGKTRAGYGGFGYLKQGIWWMGLISMGLGEACNFAAYAFAPASLVTPLGALSVLITAVLASKYLKEKMNIFAKLGCVLCILGSTVTVIHAPKEKVTTSEQLHYMLLEKSFLSYLAFVFFTSVSFIFYFGPKYGDSNVLIYVTICSVIGSISVMTCKGLGLIITESFGGANLFTGLFWLFLLSTVFTVMIQMNYLNKALDIFNTSVVTPIYYVFFTSFVMIASAILFKELPNNISNVLGTLSGFLTIIIGIFLLNAFKDFVVTWDTINKTFRIASQKVAEAPASFTYSYRQLPSQPYDAPIKNKPWTKKKKKRPKTTKTFVESEDSSDEIPFRKIDLKIENG